MDELKGVAPYRETNTLVTGAEIEDEVLYICAPLSTIDDEVEGKEDVAALVPELETEELWIVEEEDEKRLELVEDDSDEEVDGKEDDVDGADTRIEVDPENDEDSVDDDEDGSAVRDAAEEPEEPEEGDTVGSGVRPENDDKDDAADAVDDDSPPLGGAADTRTKMAAGTAAAGERSERQQARQRRCAGAAGGCLCSRLSPTALLPEPLPLLAESLCDAASATMTTTAASSIRPITMAARRCHRGLWELWTPSTELRLKQGGCTDHACGEEPSGTL